MARKNSSSIHARPQIEGWPRENSVDAVIETVTDDVHFNAARQACLQQFDEPFVDLYRIQQRINLIFRCPHQAHLRGEALARSDASLFPVLFNLQPARIGKCFKDGVNRIAFCDRSVEVQKDDRLFWLSPSLAESVSPAESPLSSRFKQ